VARSYGAIPPAVLPAVAPAPEPEQTRERVVRAPKPIATDRLLIGYKAPGQDDPDWAVLEIIATLLAGCPSARLYRRLVIDREAASSVDAQLTPFRDPSLLRLAVTAARGHTADEILAVTDRELAAMAEQPPRHAEVEKAKAIAETDFWTSLVDVDGKAEAIGHYETALGDFRKVNAVAERLAAVTADDVARCVRAYLRADHRTVVIAEPESPDLDGGEPGDDQDDQDDHAE
jgi:zinc protease